MVDSHVHLITPELIPTALAAGVTTLITAGFEEPPWAMERTLRSFEEWPINIGLQANARTGEEAALDALLDAGAVGFKIHEDYGAYPSLIDRVLGYADAHDVSVSLHTDGLNESAELEDTVAATLGRTVHAYHVEGAGGGHVPDVIGLVREPNIICSSTTPTFPYGVNAVAEHLPMTLLNHGGSWDDRGRRRGRARTDHATHNGRRRAAPRTRRDRHHQQRLAGHGPHRRDTAANTAAGPRHESLGGRREPDDKRPTTTSASCATWPSAPSSRR